MQAAGQARERLLFALHDAGIDTSSPLGLLLLQQQESVEALAHEAGATRRVLQEALDASEAGLRELKAELTKGYSAVADLQTAGETRLQNQEILMQREHQDAVAKMVSAITRGVRGEVFAILRAQLPVAERQFFFEARWRSWARMAAAAAVVLVLGVGVGAGMLWRDAGVGAWCADAAHIVKTPGGTAYCHIPELDGRSPAGDSR